MEEWPHWGRLTNDEKGFIHPSLPLPSPKALTPCFDLAGAADNQQRNVFINMTSQTVLHWWKMRTACTLPLAQESWGRWHLKCHLLFYMAFIDLCILVYIFNLRCTLVWVQMCLLNKRACNAKSWERAQRLIDAAFLSIQNLLCLCSKVAWNRIFTMWNYFNIFININVYHFPTLLKIFTLKNNEPKWFVSYYNEKYIF